MDGWMEECLARFITPSVVASLDLAHTPAHPIREDRDQVTMTDFERAVDKVFGENPMRTPDASGAMYA